MFHVIYYINDRMFALTVEEESLFSGDDDDYDNLLRHKLFSFFFRF